MSRNSSRRAYKEPPASIKAKFAEARLNSVVHISAKTENQATSLELMKRKQLVVLYGSSGSGKTFLACTHAANEYLKGNIKKIVLIRPYEQLSRSIGLRPGTGDEKLKPLMQSMLQTLEGVFGKAQLDAKINEGTIVLEALEDCRGRSYANSFVIVDESQNTTKHAMKALLTRLEDSSRMVLCGDIRQTDIKEQSGLDWLISMMDKVKGNASSMSYLDEEDVWNARNNYGSVKFNNTDIVRGGLCKLFVKLFDNE